MLAAILLSVNALACVGPVRPAPERESAAWVVSLGTPAHDYSARETLNPEPHLLWQVDVGRASRGTPAIGDEVIAVTTVDRMLTVVERQTGEILWRRRLASPASAGPLMDQDRIYAATDLAEGRVYSLRLRDGRTMWSQRLADVSAPLLLAGDALIAVNEQGWVVCYDAERGVVRWRRRLSRPIRTAPAAHQDAIFVASEDSLVTLARSDGTIRAAIKLPGALTAPPAVYGEALYAGTMSGTLARIRLPDLTIAWELPLNGPVAGAVAVTRDTVFAVTRDGTLWLVPVDGASRPRQMSLGAAVLAGPTPLARGVLVGTASGELLLVDPAGVRPIWHGRVEGPVEQPPLVRDGTLVVISGKGDLMAYR